jgi:hypothetical protein
MQLLPPHQDGCIHVINDFERQLLPCTDIIGFVRKANCKAAIRLTNLPSNSSQSQNQPHLLCIREACRGWQVNVFDPIPEPVVKGELPAHMACACVDGVQAWTRPGGVVYITPTLQTNNVFNISWYLYSEEAYIPLGYTNMKEVKQ